MMGGHSCEAGWFSLAPPTTSDKDPPGERCSLPPITHHKQHILTCGVIVAVLNTKVGVDAGHT